MPPQVAPDPSRPGGWMWVDSDTGQPIDSMNHPSPGAPTPPAPAPEPTPAAPTAPAPTAAPAADPTDLPSLLATKQSRAKALEAILADPNATPLQQIDAGKELGQVNVDIRTMADTLARIQANNPQNAARTDQVVQKTDLEKKLDEEREYNAVDHPGQPAHGYVTHQQARAMDQAQQRLDQDRAHQQNTDNTQAGAAQTNADTAASTAARQQRLDELAATRDQAAIDARKAQDDLTNKRLDIQQQIEQGKLTLDQAKEQDDVNTKNADRAVTAARDANTAWYQQQQIVDAQTAQTETGRHNVAGETNATAQTAETTRANTATEAQTATNNANTTDVNAATLLERQQADQANARAAAGTAGQKILDERAKNAIGLSDDVFNQAAGAKNYGLGSRADISQLPQASEAWATEMGGGQAVMDEAAQMVHNANPAMAGTPAGAQMAALLSQVLERQKQVTAAPAPAPASSPTSSFTAPASAATPQGPSTAFQTLGPDGLPVGMSGTGGDTTQTTALPDTTPTSSLSPVDENGLAQPLPPAEPTDAAEPTADLDPSDPAFVGKVIAHTITNMSNRPRSLSTFTAPTFQGARA